MAGLSPYDLQVEHLRTPMGVDASVPRFQWKLRSDRRDAASAGARIRVLREPDGAPVWDSGWLREPHPGGVPYAGTSLQSETRYRWTLEVDDGAGAGTAHESWFEMGLLDPASRTAAWIAPAGESAEARTLADTADAATVATLRRSFDLPATGIVAARLYATARGVYLAHLNGERVGDQELAPGWTDYRERIAYQTYDVTALVRSGTNVLGVELAAGWWSGRAGFDPNHRRHHYGQVPAAWARLHVRFEDGTAVELLTDEHWRWSAGARVYADLFAGERIAGDPDPRAWCVPEVDDAGWSPVAIEPGDGAMLVGIVDEPVRVVDSVAAISVIPAGPATWIYDFGQNLVGRVRLDVPTLPVGTEVQLRHAEILADGALYTANLRGVQATDVFVSSGHPQRFEPAFTTHGFRYVELSGNPEALPLDAVIASVLSSDLPAAGSVRTSEPDVNRLIGNIERGQRGNFVGLPTDCPQRDERLGWMADAQVFLPTAAYTSDVSAHFTRWLRDVRSAQTADGSFADVAPVLDNLDHDGAPAWGDAGVIIPWTLYRTYGDRRLLEDSLPSMRRWVDFLALHNPELIWSRRRGKDYGDWLQIGAETPKEVLATAYFARSAAIVAQAARALGENGTGDRYGELARCIREAFRAAFLEPDLRIAGDTQTVYLLALAFDLVHGDERDAIGAHLVRCIEDNDGLLTTGFVGVSLLCPVLSDLGRDDLAFSLLQETRYPSWLYSVRHGATTIWERWDGWTEHAGFQSASMNSFNHYALGSVGEWLYRSVAGIDQEPDSIAFERIRIAPRVGGTLTSAAATFESPRGRIASSWSIVGDVFTLLLELPPGAPTTVWLPGGTMHTVGSGSHEFSATVQAA
jgi:alpha-L-rhamnosidase